ncbi:MAG TPA: recombinase family protein [Phycisphaerae bacterium]|nr:recombinase family protein [Phycisphaerae bacterium]
MSKAIGYVRVSTADQAINGVSVDAQTARIRAWCDANGYELAGVHTDAGLSGKRAGNRAGLQDALATVCKLRGVLVVYSLSRLARSTRDAIDIADRLHRAGADLVSLTESIDTTTAAGKMVFRMLAVLAEFERDLVSERTTAALAHKRGKGERVGTIPFGWSLADDGVTLEPVESEQAAVCEITAMRAERRSYRWIAEELTRRGVPTKIGGAVWTHQTVASILRRVASATLRRTERGS